MRKLFSALLALGIMMSGVMGVAAQEAGSAYASGVGSSATWTDDRGNVVATLEVTDVVADWDEYDDRSAPTRGYVYYAVTFAVTNEGSGSVEVERNRFTLLDSAGLNNSSSRVDAADGSTAEILEDTASLEAGEQGEFTLVFQLFSDVTPAMFTWQPDSGRIVLVNVGEDGVDPTSVATGFDAPATWTDDRGNQVASLEVLEIEEDWQDYGEYETPDRGSSYVAIHFRVTNLSNADIEVEPFNLSMLDSESANNGRSYARGNDDVADSIFIDSTSVAPGESIEGLLVFEVFGGVEPVALIWQPEWGALSIVVLSDDEATQGTDATPEESVDDDEDTEATPAS